MKPETKGSATNPLMGLWDSPRGFAAMDEQAPLASPTRPRQSWKRKFGVAFRGFKLGVRGQSSFFVHFFFAAVVLAAAGALKCTAIEWCLLLGCIGLVLTVELMNSAVETLFRGLEEPGRERAWPALDIAAAAVLLACTTAAVIGTIIFLPKLAALLLGK
jgi:diacylglycerol kinase